MTNGKKARQTRRPWRNQRHSTASREPAPRSAPNRDVPVSLSTLGPELMTLARPLVPMGGDADFTDWRSALTIAVTAWNAVSEREDADAALAGLDIDAETRAGLRVLVATTMEHKRLLYPDDCRLITRWELELGKDDECHLEIEASEIRFEQSD